MSCPRRSCLTLREEFRLKRFGFGDVYRGRFFMWQWRIPPILYLLYRLVLAVYVDVWLIYLTAGSGSMDLPNGLSMAAFLTNWTYTVLALYMTTNFVAAFYNYFCLRLQDTHFMRRPPSEGHQNMFPEISSDPWMVSSGYEAVPDSDEEVDIRLYRLPWYLKIVWILFNVVSSSAVMVTIIFFAVLFPEMTGAKVGSMDNVQLHMLNSVIVVVEHLVSAIPIRLLHVIYPITYGLVYVFFSLFYWIPDHNHVMYPNVLDWNQPGLTIGMICLIGFVIIPVFHSVFYLIYQLKMAIYKRLVK